MEEKRVETGQGMNQEMLFGWGGGGVLLEVPLVKLASIDFSEFTGQVA